ncbi:mitochondrial 54S ribosomal protein uL2m RML2 [Sporobolomyces koalae]|uniref:mitochondrial 54S ribosomal protein uL2m RML2 n=1 Tax=Sporobolomyces koalae TaxID=500713 RepID=UPI00317A9087
MSQIARATRVTAFARPSSVRSFSTSLAALKPPTSATTTDPETGRTKRILTFSKKSGLSNFKTYLPVTPSLRQLRQPISEHLHKGGPYRDLTEAKRSTGGRNHHGRITTRARGGGHKRRIRLVDFTRRETGQQEVVRIEYDPGRSAHIALLRHQQSGAMSYILAPTTLRQGDLVQSFRSGVPETFHLKPESVSAPSPAETELDPSSPQSVLPPLPGSSSSKDPADLITPPSPSSLAPRIDLAALRQAALKPGNCLPLRLIPVGTLIHAISLSPIGPAVLARSAGSSARIISASSPSGKHAQVRMSSGEVRYVGLDCVASVGVVSNQDHQHRNLGKAGRMRWLGFRPQSRGVAMNARDHPHGGGRGKSKGNVHPVSFSNVGAKGQRTRSPKSKNGNKMVVKERPRGTEKNSRRG